MSDESDESNDERAAFVLHNDDSSFELSSVHPDDDDEYEEDEESRPKRRSTSVARKTIPAKLAASGAVKQKTTAHTAPLKNPIPSTPSNLSTDEGPQPPLASSTKKRKRNIKRSIFDADGYDIVLPNSLLDSSQSNAEFSLLLQMDDPQLSEGEGGKVDWSSAIGGVIGRMELGASPDQAIVLDLQGQQYQGYLFPGPTACVLSLITQEAEKNDTTEGNSVLMLEHMTDEFCNLVRRPKSDPVSATSDNYFHYQGEVDVNREAHSNVTMSKEFAMDHSLQSPVKTKPRSQGAHNCGNKKKRRPATKK